MRNKNYVLGLKIIWSKIADDDDTGTFWMNIYIRQLEYCSA